jgi:hypothetical protein
VPTAGILECRITPRWGYTPLTYLPAITGGYVPLSGRTSATFPGKQCTCQIFWDPVLGFRDKSDWLEFHFSE